MADYPASLENLVGLTEFVGSSTPRAQPGNLSTLALTAMDQATAYELADEGTIPALLTEAGGTLGTGGYADQGAGDHLGYTEQILSTGDPWFEKIIVFPSSIELGNIFATQDYSVEVYNSFKETNQTFSSFTNNVGSGTSITDLPSLPTTSLYQRGIVMNYEVPAEGPPTVEGTLDFAFSIYTVMITVTGQRIVVFPFPPESALVERLKFLTSVLTARDGTEQRVKLRKSPRQEFEYRLKLDGDDRRFYDSLMFDRQAGTFGLPLWHQATYVAADASASDLTITVDSTDYADYRVGGFVVIYTSRKVIDALEIDSLTATTITFTSGLNYDFDTGALVMPMRTAQASESIKGRRALVNLGSPTINFRVLDNDSGIADASAFNTLNGKVYLDGPNAAASNGVPHSTDIKVFRQDGETGQFSQTTPWTRNKRIYQKGFTTSSRQAAWETAQLLHYLSGQRESFYLPTFYDELVVQDTITMGSSTVDIENVGFTRFIQDRSGYIRFLFADDTIVVKEILSSAEIDDDVETLTFTDTWALGYTVADVVRVDYVETMRSSTDTIEIRHLNGVGYTSVQMPVQEVISE